MKVIIATMVVVTSLISSGSFGQTASVSTQVKNSKPSGHAAATNNLYLDVHHFGPGKVKYQDVVNAHAKDLSVQKKYGVDFINFWLDEQNGTVYCLSSSADTQSIRKTHQEAHGLLPQEIFLVSSGNQSAVSGSNPFFIDVHYLGAGKVTAGDVAGAHEKDLATQGKYGVHFINYWVDEKNGMVVCLSQAPDSSAVINTHREAHGLLPSSIVEVKPGNE